MRSASVNATRRTPGRWNASLPSAPRSCCRWPPRGWPHPDLVSSLASRLARLGLRVDERQRSRIAREADGATLEGLTGELLHSIDPDAAREAALAECEMGDDAEPTNDQLQRVERERMTTALKPFTRPGLRDVIVEIGRSFFQVIDEGAIDELLGAGSDGTAAEKARSRLDDFRRFLEDNRDRIEALRILYSRPYRAGLRFRHVKELRDALRNPPLGLSDPARGLWRLYETAEPEKVMGAGGDALVDLVALVRHEISPAEPLAPLADQVEARFRDWLVEKESRGQTFTPEQRRWLDAIKDHIASSLAVDRDAFEYAPFSQMGGLGAVYGAFGEDLDAVLAELNERLAA